ncbi:4'-phosphopantetheinyl transferase family protein [Streptomyces sp. NPDC059717]|uniref:4'-phosphopantetheinyl transferase family protein n=1 Tax=Streptomyces sp. NPDC059717 TaxID=3346922 RepID=UPI0036C4D752
MTELHLEADRLDLWLLTPPGAVPLPLGELDEAERHRADAFRRPADRALYIAAHIALRRLLGAYLRIPARDVTFTRADCPRCGGPHGRPVLAGAAPGAPHFSLSHSRGAVLIGVARAPVGVDIEGLPRPERVSLCRSALHPWERRELEQCAGPGRPAVFARLWARKEAYLKGTGVGVGRWTSDVYLGDAGPGAPPRPDGWHVLDVPCGPGHAAAAAVRKPVRHTVVHRLRPESVLSVGNISDGRTTDARPRPSRS